MKKIVFSCIVSFTLAVGSTAVLAAPQYPAGGVVWADQSNFNTAVNINTPWGNSGNGNSNNFNNNNSMVIKDTDALAIVGIQTNVNSAVNVDVSPAVNVKINGVSYNVFPPSSSGGNASAVRNDNQTAFNNQNTMEFDNVNAFMIWTKQMNFNFDNNISVNPNVNVNVNVPNFEGFPRY